VSTLTKGFFYEGFEEFSNRTTGSAHSGASYYDGISGGGYAVNFPLPDARSYTIQWWKWTAGKWLLQQQPYTGSFTILGVIDDIRIFPSDGFMTTATYKLQTGKGSETDAAGRTTSYEYDGLGRLSLVRDNDKNIISRICNTYTGQTAGCPAGTIYTNVAVNKTATKNDCGTNFQGGSATYTVPAGKYTSSLSQTDANQQAQIEANLNAQAYANANGTCTQIYKNVVKTGSFTRNNCTAGFVGSTVVYTVPAGRYSSLISQADADQQAQNDVNNNGQSNANTNGSCTSVNIRKVGTITSGSVTFTSTVAANIILSIYGDPGNTYSMSYNLTGPSSKSGTLCAARTSVTCSNPESITFTNMPAGTYTLSANLSSGNPLSRTMEYIYYVAP
jgi:YD repeat-containing protein